MIGAIFSSDTSTRRRPDARDRILAAAAAEFSTHGISGARVDRIAKDAGCSKNLIYVYFNNKEALFATILEKNLANAYEDLPITAGDLSEYAVRVFDLATARPDLMRLMMWSCLEGAEHSAGERQVSRAAKRLVVTKAQAAGQVRSEFPPDFLLTAVMRLATAWSAAAPAIVDRRDPGANHLIDVRADIAMAVSLLTEP